MAVLCINLSGSNAVIRDINRAKDELENILKDLNKAQDNISNSIYINGLSSYRSSIESEKLSVQRDIQKLANFSKAYKSFLENAERIDKQYAKIISNAGYDYRNETGLIKEEWKKTGKLIIGTLVIAGTVAAAIFIGGPVLIGAAVGATVSAAIGAGAGYLTGGAEGAIDGFFYGSISGAITGAVGGLVAGPPPALGSAPKEVLKYIAKQSIADGVGEGLAGGTVGYMKGGTEGAVAGGVSGLVSGTVTGLISGGVSYKAQGLPQKIINKFKDGKVGVDIDTNGVSKVEVNRLEYLRGKYGKISPSELHERINTPKIRRMLEDYSPSQKALSWQGNDPYFGKDLYIDKVYSKGTILYAGEPFPTGYFTSKETLGFVGTDAREIFEGLQVKPYWEKGMSNAIFRDKMVGYELKVDLTGANGIAKKNPQFGKGGLEQILISDLQELIHNGFIERIGKTEIKLNNVEMPYVEYKEIIDKIRVLGGKGY